ncbi:Zn-dependent hydrolase [Halobacillus aidingensis]|uniref:Allantoate deiminase n=1 Tax=Halobacillus aidingensis TaxID=240303 RepID=A0A1H0QPN3_HALAD|nr:Zn-dependent hydrolase [Halobacillus aidingensis]SDP18676.1 allantoate deiminase [Halobacillus aidingensis]
MEKKLLKDFDHRLNYSGVNGKRLAARIQEISEIGRGEKGSSYRIGFSEEERKAKTLVKQWMDEAGMNTWVDEAGNVFGQLLGRDETLPIVLAGSHIDTVPNGGHFDGVLGVLSALEVVEAWKEIDYEPMRTLEVVVFSDEEGARFNRGFSGSKAVVGDVDAEEQKSLTDINGVPFEEVMKSVDLSVGRFPDAERNLHDIKMFVEVHIEQGKQLEKEDVPVGIVTGIAGPCWLKFNVQGRAGHAGNTPMNDRKDALVAASELIFNIPSLPAQVSSSAVATVGKTHVYPNGVNVIPGEVELYVDIRDIHESTRDKLVDLVIEKAEEIVEKHGVSLEWEEATRTKPVPIKEVFQKTMATSVENHGIRPVFLPSGAGHDAMILGRHVPISMLFVRSKDGISHNSEEWSSLNDCVQGIHVLKDFLEKVTQED